MSLLSPEELEVLSRIDSPTIANAIESFNVRDATSGYASMELRCQNPDLKPMVGYAVTCLADSTTLARRPTKEQELFDVVLAAPKPTVVVIKDVGSDRLRSCHAGDNLCAIFQRLGAVGLVTDGGIRDLAGIRQRAPGFQVFAAGLVVSHGNPTFLEIGVTVSICELTIRPGDLLHGDQSGLLVVPLGVAGQVAPRAQAILEKEKDLIDFVRSDRFDLAELKRRMSH